MKRHKSIKKFSKAICVTAICFSLLPKEHLLAGDAHPFVNENSTVISNEDSTTTPNEDPQVVPGEGSNKLPDESEKVPDEIPDNDFDEDSDKISDEDSDEISDEKTDRISDESSDEPIYYQTQPDSIGYRADGVDLEEIYDPTEPIALLDRDDFYNDEDYLDYLRRNNVPEDYIKTHLLNENEEEYKVTPGDPIEAENQYYFELEEKKTNAIQSFDIVGDDIYISQVFERTTPHNGFLYVKKKESKNKGEEERENAEEAEEIYVKEKPYKYVRISRCQLIREEKGKKFYGEVSAMVLQDVGHGQTLRVYEYDHKTYLLVSCGTYQPNGQEGKPWSTQIGRIEYEPDTTVHNSNIKRLTYLNYSNKAAKSFGATKRVDATLSTDKTSLLIWKRNRGKKDNDEFSVYDFNEINKIFDASSSNTISFKENKDLKAACRSSKRKAREPISMQGLALSNIGANGLHSVYMSSGNEQEATGSDSHGNYLYRFNSAGVLRKMLKISDKGVWNGYGSAFENQDVTAEIEGARISGDDLQFVLRNTEQPKHQVIAKIPKGLLK